VTGCALSLSGTGASLTGWFDRRFTPLLLGLVAGLLAVAAGLLAGGDAAERAGLAARWTARAGLPLFLVAFLASTLVRRWPGPATRALLRRRRQWGLGFALSHTIHLVALGINVIVYAPGRTWQSLIGGGLAYALIYLMALTSTDGWQRRLGRWWGRLHRFGIYYIWFIFTASYAGRALGDDPGKRVVGLIFGSILIAALALRLWPQRRRAPCMSTG
jgi:methionine sulfoxide reductase heme-binding subunit